MERIRYSKTAKENVLNSKQMFDHPTNGARYKVVLDQNEMQYLVVDDTCDVVITTGHASTLHKLKIGARNALSALGVSLSKEQRTKKVVQTLANHLAS